ncbi:type I restriction enzyme S subunit [Paenibacillus phyllosphaerae]|uniref:Type I restriction enzyme S subunit n=1 Tax=Paenibacillus phyllosphaerae TaxID=274593 RepID=A0A7W5AZS2_9BACL|nr:restriction endonuclease subunit S [Paenibacillus phyllosphaerae]MBB3111784.1 type I restriction enzyme S subunit [Paenibacillus phyllosphaerae]
MSFKETLVGKIPVNWLIVSVGELVDEGVLLKPLDGNHGGIHPKGSDFVATGIPFIMASDINNGVLSFNECKFITELQASKLRKGFAEEGDVLITHKATIGRVALVKKNPYKFIMLTPQVTYYRVANKKKLDNKFLKYYFEYSNFKSLLYLWSGAGSTRSYIGITEQLKLPIIVPPIEEQQKISSILFGLDEKIELNNSITKNLEEMTQAIFKRWFVEFEFPNENGDPYKSNGGDFNESELGLIPKGWQVLNLDNFVQINPKRAMKKKAIYPYVEMKNLINDYARVLEHTDRELSSGSKFTNGDVLLARITPCLENGKTAFVDFLEKDQLGWGSTEFIVLRTYDGIPNEFAYFLARSELFRSHAITNMTGSSGRQRVSESGLKNFRIALPLDLKLIVDFGRIAKSALELMKKNDDESNRLKSIRDSLLPKLMSGEIRVPVKQYSRVQTTDLPKAAESKEQYTTT